MKITHMFDSTPLEALEILFLTAAVYGAAQDWGTLLRVIQFFYATSSILIWFIWSASIANFDAANLLPWLPQEFSGVLRGTIETWNIYSGYEVILILLPLVYKLKTNPIIAVAGAFGLITVMYTVGIAILLGVMSAASINATSHPTIIAIRAVELPGTFVERLENYLLFLWIPIVYINFTIGLYCLSFLCSRILLLQDHRPFVYFLAPFIMIGTAALVRSDFAKEFGDITQALGLTFSFGVVPALYLLALWQRRHRLE